MMCGHDEIKNSRRHIGYGDHDLDDGIRKTTQRAHDSREEHHLLKYVALIIKISQNNFFLNFQN